MWRLTRLFTEMRLQLFYAMADPGDPPLEVIWIRNNTQVDKDFTQLHQNSQPVEALIIENIQDSDAGDYLCGFNLSTGFIGATITVNVISLPDNIRILLPSVVSIRYGDPLDLECRTEPEDSSLQYTWFTVYNEIENRTLLLLPEQVYIGECRCSVYMGDRELSEHSVFINVTSIPPLPEDPELAIRNTVLEREALVMSKQFRFALNLDDLTIQWEKIVQDRRDTYDFDSRFTYFFRDTRMILIINDTQLSDRGSYQVNIFNNHGRAILMVELDVIRLERTSIQMHFTDISCDFVQSKLLVCTILQ